MLSNIFQTIITIIHANFWHKYKLQLKTTKRLFDFKWFKTFCMFVSGDNRAAFHNSFETYTRLRQTFGWMSGADPTQNNQNRTHETVIKIRLKTSGYGKPYLAENCMGRKVPNEKFPKIRTCMKTWNTLLHRFSHPHTTCPNLKHKM